MPSAHGPQPLEGGPTCQLTLGMRKPDFTWRTNTHYPARTCLAKSASSLRNQYKYYFSSGGGGAGVLVTEPIALLHICAGSCVLWVRGWCLRPPLLFLSTMADCFGHASYAHSPQGPRGTCSSRRPLCTHKASSPSVSSQNSKGAISMWCGDREKCNDAQIFFSQVLWS